MTLRTPPATAAEAPAATEKSAARNRLTPIKESIQSIHGYPTTLAIYRTDASRFYWVRLYRNGRYRVKTTKSESVKAAKAFAIKFYEQSLLSDSVTHTADKRKSFAVIAHAYFKSTEKNATATVHRTDVSRFKNDLLPFFADQEIDTITNAQIGKFLTRLKERELSAASVKHFFVVLRKIMKYAIANDLMTTLPVFPKVSGRLQTAQKRDYLTQEEYNKIIKSAEQLADEKVFVRGVQITLEMKYLIQFMVNSFIRPSDLRVLKHKHVKKKNDEESEWLVLSHPATKTTATEVQAMPASVFIYDRLLEFRRQCDRKPTLDEFVFFPDYQNRDTAMAVIARLFKKIVEHALIENESDKHITLYSLRHTSIMLRLVIGGVDSLALARNARTSQAMIDKFYASHLTTDLVRKQLHAFPNEKQQAKKQKAKSPRTAGS